MISYKIIKRNGVSEDYDRCKIENAITKAVASTKQEALWSPAELAR